MPSSTWMTAEPMATALEAVAVAAPSSAQVTATALETAPAKDPAKDPAPETDTAMAPSSAKDTAMDPALATDTPALATATEKATATLMALEMDNYARFSIGTSI